MAKSNRERINELKTALEEIQGQVTMKLLKKSVTAKLLLMKSLNISQVRSNGVMKLRLQKINQQHHTMRLKISRKKLQKHEMSLLKS